MTKALSDIAALLGTPVPAGAEARQITGVAALPDASDSELSYITSDQYLKDAITTRATALLVQKRVKLPPEVTAPALVVEDAELAIGRVLALFAPPIPRPAVGIDAAARISASATIGEGAAVGPFVFVGAGARVGRHCILHAGAYVGDATVLGEDCELFPNVVIRERCTLGNRVVVHAGAIIGSDGFGYRWDGSKHAKIPQIGTVIIGDDVEIGSAACIDRAKFGATTIGAGTKIDNLVQIAHNCQIGAHCIIAGQTGLAGSAKLGRGVVLGGQVAVRDHITLGDGAMAAATSGIAEDVPPKTIVSGTPALPHRQSLREQGALRTLPQLRDRVRDLEEQLEAIKQRLGAT